MKKPYTAITVLIERLTSEEYEENDYGGLPELIESIKLQDSGPLEASRAIRKKLKYGNIHRQLRSLTLLDALISNAGPRFQRTFADGPLLERLRLAATEPTTDPDVKVKLQVLFAHWAREYKDAQGLQGITNLYKQFPRRTRPAPKPVAVTKPAPAVSPPSPGFSRSPPSASLPPSSSTTKLSEGGWRNSHKKSTSKSKTKQPAFNLEKEKPALNLALANSSVASTNLLNALKLINREKERPSEKPETVQLYESCKSLRSNILRFIQHVESEQWLGSLIHAHEELATALELYENYDKPIEEDSDSDDDWNFVSPSDATDNDAPPPAMPPRPKGKMLEEGEEEEEEDPDDPFGDRYGVVDDGEDDSRIGMPWKVL